MNDVIRDFAGGVNVYAHPLFAPKDSLARCENLDLSVPGSARVRPGLARPDSWPGAFYAAEFGVALSGKLHLGDVKATWGSQVRVLIPMDFRFGGQPTVAQEEG